MHVPTVLSVRKAVVVAAGVWRRAAVAAVYLSPLAQEEAEGDVLLVVGVAVSPLPATVMCCRATPRKGVAALHPLTAITTHSLWMLLSPHLYPWAAVVVAQVMLGVEQAVVVQATSVAPVDEGLHHRQLLSVVQWRMATYLQMVKQWGRRCHCLLVLVRVRVKGVMV
jgi:hypothetical protein